MVLTGAGSRNSGLRIITEENRVEFESGLAGKIK